MDFAAAPSPPTVTQVGLCKALVLSKKETDINLMHTYWNWYQSNAYMRPYVKHSTCKFLTNYDYFCACISSLFNFLETLLDSYVAVHCYFSINRSQIAKKNDPVVHTYNMTGSSHANKMLCILVFLTVGHVHCLWTQENWTNQWLADLKRGILRSLRLSKEISGIINNHAHSAHKCWLIKVNRVKGLKHVLSVMCCNTHLLYAWCSHIPAIITNQINHKQVIVDILRISRNLQITPLANTCHGM